MTQKEFDQRRKECKERLQGTWTIMDVNKLRHKYKMVRAAFNEASELTGNRNRMKMLEQFPDLAKDKLTPTVMALTDFCQQHDISLKRWCLAQARLIRIQYFTLYQCYGEKAFKRYLFWEAKEQKKALRKDEVTRATTSAYDVIRHSIISNHEAALRWATTLKQLKPPSRAAGLLYMFPQISGWYLIAHAEFREEVMDIGFCTEPNLLKLYKRYKNSQNVRQVCEDTLEQAISQLGPLKW